MKLEDHSELQCGTELLYLFVMDLMGRHTPAARIFSTKTEQSVKNTHYRVSTMFKISVIAAVVVLDVLCVVYSIILSDKKLLNWYDIYLLLFVAYSIIDFIFIEGGKVVWVHYLIPQFVVPNARDAQQGKSSYPIYISISSHSLERLLLVSKVAYTDHSHLTHTHLLSPL